MKDAITIFVVAGDSLTRKSLCTHVEAFGWTAAPCRNIASFFDRRVSGEPGCVLLDIKLLGTNGHGTIQRLTGQGDAIPVVIVSNKADTETVVQAMQSGAFDFLKKPVDAHSLSRRIKQALIEDTRRRELSPAVNNGNGNGDAVLSPRLEETLQHLMAGNSEKQIAEKLYLSQYTVHDYIKALYKHFDVSSRAELMATCYALENGGSR